MNKEQTEIIKKSLLAGLDRHATRRECISLGVTTESFDDAYNTVLKELNVPEPKQMMPKLNATGEAPLKFKTQAHTRFTRRLKMAFMLLVLAGAVLYAVHTGIQHIDVGSFIPEVFKDTNDGASKTHKNVSIADTILQKKVDATVTSAHIYNKRMATYEGVCRDIIVVEPVKCREINETYVIYVPLSDGTQYCVDSTQKVSNSVDPDLSLARCQ